MAAADIAQRKAPPAAPPPAPPPIAYEGGIPPGTTIQDLLQQDLAAKRAAAAQAPVPSAPPAEPATATPGPAAGTPQPTVEELSRQINEGLPSEPAAKPPYVPPERGNIATKLGDMLAENGYTLAKLNELEPAEGLSAAELAQRAKAREQFYKNLGGAHRTGYEPSEPTIDLIRQRVADRTAMQTPAQVIVMPTASGEPARPMTALERMAAKTDAEYAAKQAKARAKAAGQ